MPRIAIPAVEVSRENMYVWKNFAREVVAAEAARRGFTDDVLVEELAVAVKATGENREKVIRRYLDPHDTTIFSTTRFQLMLQKKLLKWQKNVQNVYIVCAENSAAQSLRVGNWEIQSIKGVEFT